LADAGVEMPSASVTGHSRIIESRGIRAHCPAERIDQADRLTNLLRQKAAERRGMSSKSKREDSDVQIHDNAVVGTAIR